MIYLHTRIGYWELQNQLPDSYAVGSTVEEFNEGYYILLNDTQLAFKNEHPDATPIEVINAKLHEVTVDEARENKIIEIKEYDESLNKFYFDNNQIWLSKDERLNIKDRCERCIENKININLRCGDLVLSNQDPKVIRTMLEDMGLYADKCYDNTQSKYEELNKKTTVEEIQSIDATTGYPEVVFDVTAEIDNRINNNKSEEASVVSLMKMQINTMVLTDSQALTVKTLYPEWSEFIGKELPSGYRVKYNDALYNVRQTVSQVLENQPPSTATAALYEEINETHSGTKEDPIPYNNNMELFKDKYYIQDGVTYKCIRDTGTPVYNKLSDLVGIYVSLA